MTQYTMICYIMSYYMILYSIMHYKVTLYYVKTDCVYTTVCVSCYDLMPYTIAEIYIVQYRSTLCYSIVNISQYIVGYYTMLYCVIL